MTSPWDFCACGHPMLLHDVDDMGGTNPTCCAEGCDQVGCGDQRPAHHRNEGYARQVRMVEHGRTLLAGYDCPDHPGPLDDARNHTCRMRPITERNQP